MAPGGNTIWESAAGAILLGIAWYFVWVRRVTEKTAPPVPATEEPIRT